jgi:Protein of unknown function (DUF4013)
MEYLKAYQSFFETPKWPLHLLIGAVAQFVPIVGPIVLLGFIYDVIEAKHRHGSNAFPLFDFNRLGAYLQRGLWPFLVSLVVSIPLVLLVIPMFTIFAITMSVSAGRNDGSPVFPLAFMAVAIPLFIILSITLRFVTMPMVLRAGLSQDFGSAFSWTFARDFLGRVWKEMLVSMLFLIATGFVVVLAGILVLIVGIYAAVIVIMFAQMHLQYQLYELYLGRGGTPIPLKENFPVPPLPST